MGWKIFGKPKGSERASSSYALFCQEKNPGACLTLDSEATWFLDEDSKRGSMADLEKVIAGTSNYHGALSPQVWEPGWMLPWGEYPTRGYRAAEMVQAGLAVGGHWCLCGLRAEAGAIALFLRHVDLPGEFCEVLIGCKFTELHLAVQTSDPVRICVRGDEREVPDRLTDAGSLWRVGLVLKREAVQVRGLAKLVTQPYIALETSIRETVGLGQGLATDTEQSTPTGQSLSSRAGETFKFVGKKIIQMR